MMKESFSPKGEIIIENTIDQNAGGLIQTPLFNLDLSISLSQNNSPQLSPKQSNKDKRKSRRSKNSPGRKDTGSATRKSINSKTRQEKIDERNKKLLQGKDAYQIDA